MSAFSQGDVLICPSLSEGTALVMLEAIATGLPVIATKEAGAPASALVVPRCNADAIGAALISLVETPGLLTRLSMRALNEASQRTEVRFMSAVAAMATVARQT
jgi:glycosyltransferase involved in cell wall biosynthesis